MAALAAFSLAYGAGAQDADGQARPGEGPAGAASIEFTPAEKAWLAAHPLIRVGAETNYAPYEFQDSRGHFAGVVPDYMQLLKQRLGVRFQVQQMADFTAVENKLRKREVDVVLALAPTADREEYLLFTRPYLHYVNVIVTRDDFGFVTGLRDLALERVGVVVGHSSQQLISLAYPSSRVTAYSDLLDGLMAVSTGKADGLVDDIFPIVYNIRYHQISNLKIATPLEKVLQPKGFSVARAQRLAAVGDHPRQGAQQHQPRGGAGDLPEMAIGPLREQGRLSRHLDVACRLLGDSAGGGAVDYRAQQTAQGAGCGARGGGGGKPSQGSVPGQHEP